MVSKAKSNLSILGTMLLLIMTACLLLQQVECKSLPSFERSRPGMADKRKESSKRRHHPEVQADSIRFDPDTIL